MWLRSPYRGSNIGAPGGLTLQHYERATRSPVTRPIPVERFVDYGRWFRGQVAPDADPRWVSRLERPNGYFRLNIGDGEDILVSGRTVYVCIRLDGSGKTPIPDDLRAILSRR